MKIFIVQFQIPQFIDREAKIIGPFTFRQFAFIGAAGAGIFILYFMVPMWLLIILGIILGGAAFSLAVVRIHGRPLPVVIMNFFMYLLSAKVYLWRRKIMPPKIIKKKPESKEDEIEEKAPSLKVSQQGNLHKLSTQVETGVK